MCVCFEKLVLFLLRMVILELERIKLMLDVFILISILKVAITFVIYLAKTLFVPVVDRFYVFS